VLEELLQRYKLTVVLFLGGVVLIGVGILGIRLSGLQEEPEVEILEAEETMEAETIIVEVAGEITKPGVYELKGGSRIGDLLTLAGGFGAEADREWVAKNINLAQKLIDGTKIFIPPKKSQTSGVNPQILGENQGVDFLASKININIASLTELDSLWGVGEVTAKKIVEGRPFERPEQLLEKKIVKSNVWEKIKDQVTVY
jgi:competence protein ComEA